MVISKKNPPKNGGKFFILWFAEGLGLSSAWDNWSFKGGF
jgi:hypothetical protein